MNDIRGAATTREGYGSLLFIDRRGRDIHHFVTICNIYVYFVMCHFVYLLQPVFIVVLQQMHIFLKENW